MSKRSIDDMSTGRRTHLRDDDKPVGASRRSALAMLGLIPAGAAFAIEHTVEQDDLAVEAPEIRCGPDCKQIPQALRRLADAIESNDAMVSRMRVVSDVSADKIIEHEFLLTFAYKV